MKEPFSIYKLHFTSPLHLGDARADYSVSLKSIASDTMYAALTSCLAKIGKDIPKDGNLGFTISSLFPFYQKDEDSEAVYFFPKPLRSVLPKLNEVEHAKTIKKVQWLDTDCFSKLLNGNVNIFDANKIEGDYLTEKEKEIDKDFITSKVNPRVTVSRTGQEDAVPFYMDRVYFKDYSGLYFMAKGNVEMLDIAINLLQYEGIGTDRNVGNGFFTFKKKEIEVEVPEDANYALSLSMFIPEAKEQLTEMLSGEKVGYDFARRGGWITTPPHNTYRKNAIYAFIHGSVFSMEMEDNVETRGRIVDLKPEIDFDEGRIDHPIWRNGRAFFIPIIV
jgi:CRISPR-associated protein Csm4